MSSNSLEGLVKLTRKVLKYTFTIEIIGTILIAFSFVPIYGWADGLFKALFQSISAFCNAGFDVIGNNSMMPFATNKIVCITCMLLTTIAGLGFLVWDDISNKILEGSKKKYSFRRIMKNLNLHTQIVLMMQLFLFLFGTITFICFEYHNPGTIGPYDFENKLLISAFQSVSLRTAGFASVNMYNLTNISKLIMTLLMLIGGGSGSMAGGIKTTTIFVIIAGVYTNIIGKKNINVFKRTIPHETFMKAISVVTITASILIISILLLLANTNINSIDLFFESSSAIATVGLSCGALGKMNLFCKYIIIALMYIGRIGTVTMAMSFVAKRPRKVESIVYAKEDIIVG